MPLALSATNSSTPSVRAQLNQYQAQLQQARREAGQAADRVARLEQQAEVARQESAQAGDRLRGLENSPPRIANGNEGASRKRINTLSQLSGTLLDVTA
jgi:chromosome segregation ATPase